MEEQWSDAGASRGHAGLAVLGGCIVLAVGAYTAPALPGSRPLALLLGGGAGAGLAIWLLAYFPAIRRASGAWKAGSLVLLLAAGAAAGFGAHLQLKMQARADAMTFAETEMAVDGTLVLPRGAAGRGPLSAQFNALVRDWFKDRLGYEQMANGLGLERLTSPWLLQEDGAVLGRCDAVAALKAKGAEMAKARKARLDALTGAIRASALPGELKRGMATMAGPRSVDGIDPVAAQEDVLHESGAELCRLLARRNWFNRGGYFGFTSGADQGAFNRLSEQRTEAAAAITRAERAAKARFAEGRGLVRDQLGKSILAD